MGRQASRVVVSRVLSARLLDVVEVSVSSGRGRELARRELEDGKVELGKRVEVEQGVDGLGEHVKDTVEDHLGVGRDDVSTVGETPGNGVKEPEEGQDDGGFGESRSVSVTESTSGLSSGAGKNPPDVEDCASVHYPEQAFQRLTSDATEGVEAPLVAGNDESADKTGDDHDQVEEDKGDDVGQGKAGRHDQGQEKGRLSMSTNRLCRRSAQLTVVITQSMYRTYQICL